MAGLDLKSKPQNESSPSKSCLLIIASKSCVQVFGLPGVDEKA